MTLPRYVLIQEILAGLFGARPADQDRPERGSFDDLIGALAPSGRNMVLR
jgi:hypothetical protein